MGGRGPAVVLLPAHAQVDGDVEHARAFGEIHAQKEDVAPAAVTEVHTHGGGFVKDGKEL
jgi:hypothetical protein